jgi:hypothetical protein
MVKQVYVVKSLRTYHVIYYYLPLPSRKYPLMNLGHYLLVTVIQHKWGVTDIEASGPSSEA